MHIGRREFIGGAGAVLYVGAGLEVFADENPLLRIGVITDTHIGKTKDTCERVRQACELFRKYNVDMMVHTGDVAEFHYPTGYQAYRETIEEVFAGVSKTARPKELFVYAAHDYFGYKDTPRKDWDNYATPAFADMKRLIGATNDPYDQGMIKGFPYVVIPQHATGGLDVDKCKKMVADACAANPGKPVFVFAHVPPERTTRTGRGSYFMKQICLQSAQVVNLSGHTHGSLSDERAIWQGAFTSVNVGCLQHWGDGRDGIAGSNVRRINNYGAVIVDVYPSRIVFRRFDVRDGAEYRADSPWIIPWPHNPSSAPYLAKKRKDKDIVPAFALDSVLKVAPSAIEDGGVRLSIPLVSGEPRPYAYRVFLDRKDASGDWRPHARRDFFGDFWQREHERPQKYEHEFANSYFEDGGKYRFRVAGVNYWGKEGRRISVEFDAPKRKSPANIVWSSSNPMEECEFRSGLSGGKLMPRDGDFYKMDGSARLEIPKDAWKGPRGTPFRLVVDIHTIQEKLPTWTIVPRNPKPLRNATGRLATPPGDSGLLRYVIDFTKLSEKHAYYLLIREGGEGKIRFGKIRVERMQG
jgi:hypothetical protein